MRPEIGSLQGPYNQSSIIQRIEALFLDNLGKIVTREMIIEVSKDPNTGKEPENWHQRLSELRTNSGYTILSKRDREWLKLQEYLMVDAKKREGAGGRVMPTKSTWEKVLLRSDNTCEWKEGNQICKLKEGDVDPVGGGIVQLTADHMNPHSMNPNSDPKDVTQWQALCGRHQVVKKNFWDSSTGKVNIIAILQACTSKQKTEALQFLLDYFGYELKQDKK